MIIPVCDCARASHQHGTRLMYDTHSCPCAPCVEANSEYSRRRRAELTDLPECTCPRATHEHGTRVMYLKHLCKCPPCSKANLDYTRDYKKRVAANILPVCACPIARHEHGTRDMYGYHQCRCTPCGEANRDYNRRSSALKPKREMVDANLARVRIDALRNAGMTTAEIAYLCGVNAKVIDFARLGRHGRKPEKVKASTLRALEAISYRDIMSLPKPAGRKVDGDLPRRQIQSLHCLGWSGRAIAERAGTAHTNISWLLAGRGTTEEVRAAIDNAYNELRLTTPPEDTPATRSQASRARNRAAAEGWSIDTAGDHEYASAA